MTGDEENGAKAGAGAAGAEAPYGLGRLEAIASGRLPHTPMWRTLGMTLSEVEPGRALFTVMPEEKHTNGQGIAHGGLTATLIDSAAACAVKSVLGPGDWSTTVEVAVKFVRPVRGEDGPVRCEGRILHAGRRIATAEARVFDRHDRLLAHGESTCMVVRAEPAAEGRE
jgi:uncharacterized protein (TIGR00369 family)